MKTKIQFLTATLSLLAIIVTPTISNGADMPNSNSFYELSAQDITGLNVPLSNYKGQVLIVVNTASKCGFTPQYKDLQEIYEKYKEKKFSVLAFPSNDFLSQEPGTNEEVQTFCTSKYGVSFPLFSKAEVSGENKQPVYRFLTEQSGEEYSGEIKWNFEKFLIDRQGKVRARFGSFTSPNSSRLISKLEELLADPES